jgi:hypothetical protein
MEQVKYAKWVSKGLKWHKFSLFETLFMMTVDFMSRFDVYPKGGRIGIFSIISPINNKKTKQI